ncbi:uncharacterized protein ACRADG_004599 [Cochliomyia hominivorax]
MFKELTIFIIGISSVLSLKCHVCDNYDSAKCLKLEKGENQFLTECETSQTKCALLEERSVDPIVRRECITPDFVCDRTKFFCYTCDTDGCNREKKVETPIQLQLPNPKIFQSNIHLVGGAGIVLLLLTIWCGIRLCTKKTVDEYEEDDCDEYYENETNIDLEDEKYPSDIQIIRKA